MSGDATHPTVHSPKS